MTENNRSRNVEIHLKGELFSFPSLNKVHFNVTWRGTAGSAQPSFSMCVCVCMRVCVYACVCLNQHASEMNHSIKYTSHQGRLSRASRLMQHECLCVYLCNRTNSLVTKKMSNIPFWRPPALSIFYILADVFLLTHPPFSHSPLLATFLRPPSPVWHIAVPCKMLLSWRCIMRCIKW